MSKRISAVALAVAATFGLAACGSSSSSLDDHRARVPRPRRAAPRLGCCAGGTVNGAGSTFAAPIYQQWGSTLKSQGLTVNYNPVGSGTGIADLQTATVDFAGSDPALMPADSQGDEGPGAPVPGRVRRDHGLVQPARGQERAEARRTDARRHLLGQDHDLERPGDQVAEPRREPAEHAHHGRPPLRLIGHDERLHEVPVRRQPDVGQGRSAPASSSSGRPAPARPGNSGVAAAVKPTSGAVGYVEQAYALVNGFTYAAVKNSAGTLRAADDPEHVRGRGRDQGPAGPRDLDASTRRTPTAYPIVSQTFLDVYTDPCKDGGASSGTATALKSFLSYAFGAGQKTLGPASGQLPYAPLPPALVATDNAQLGEADVQRVTDLVSR